MFIGIYWMDICRSLFKVVRSLLLLELIEHIGGIYWLVSLEFVIGVGRIVRVLEVLFVLVLLLESY